MHSVPAEELEPPSQPRPGGALHGVHAVVATSESLENVPGGQLEHTVELMLDANVPTGQNAHGTPPPTPKSPAAHSVPRLLVEPAAQPEPSGTAHTMHTDVLPVL